MRNDEENRRYKAFYERRHTENKRVWYLGILIMGLAFLLGYLIHEGLVMLYMVGLLVFVSTYFPCKRWFGPYDEKDWNKELKDTIGDRLKIKEKLRKLNDATLVTDGENNYIVSKTITGKYEVFHDPNIGDFVLDKKGKEIVASSFTEALLMLYEAIK